MASAAEYGANANASRSVNSQNGWGGYQWPGGVPARLLDTASHTNRWGDTVKVVVRTELVALFEVAFAIAAAMGYRIFVRDPDGSGEPWGPWSYENRAIAGSVNPSNHSRGRAIDVNAPRNPYTTKFVTDLPPRLVNAWERIGLSWGGRYNGGPGAGRYCDYMHFEYAWTPDDVDGHAKAGRSILNTVLGNQLEPDTGHPDAPAPPEEDDDMFTAEDSKRLETAADGAYFYRLVRDTSTGAVYAYAPGVFFWVQHTNHLSWLRGVEWVSPDDGDITDAYHDLVEFTRAECLRAATNPANVEPVRQPTQAAPPAEIYMVKAGDTLGAIAAAKGVTVAQLVAWNAIAKPDDISVGQVLKLAA